jgi:hypothetical protein
MRRTLHSIHGSSAGSDIDADLKRVGQTRVCATQSDNVVRVTLLSYSLAREASAKGACRVATVGEHLVWFR